MDIVGAAAAAGAIIGGMTMVTGIWATITQRVVDRRQRTVEFLSSRVADREMIRARQIFVRLHVEVGDMARFADANYEGSEETTAIQVVLNQFELISIAIQEGALDYKIYKRFNGANTIRFWQIATGFVFNLRTRLGNPNIYREIESLALWLREGKVPPRLPRFRPLLW
jgi:hypothetical protein